MGEFFTDFGTFVEAEEHVGCEGTLGGIGVFFSSWRSEFGVIGCRSAGVVSVGVWMGVVMHVHECICSGGVGAGGVCEHGIYGCSGGVYIVHIDMIDAFA